MHGRPILEGAELDELEALNRRLAVGPDGEDGAELRTRFETWACDMLGSGKTDINGYAILHQAIMLAADGNDDKRNGMVTLLIDTMAESGITLDQTVDRPVGWTGLTIATVLGNSKAIKELAKAGANVNPVGEFGMTPLLLAAMGMGGSGALTTLMEVGADMEHTNELGESVLMVAIRDYRTVCSKESGGTAESHSEL